MCKKNNHRIFRNAHPVGEVEEGALWQMIGENYVLIDLDEYYAVPCAGFPDSFVELPDQRYNPKLKR
jgi:hypothetical protein